MSGDRHRIHSGERKVDHLIDVPCDNCPTCKAGSLDPILRLQGQTDIPPVEPVVTRFDIHGSVCALCQR
jgi:hypothetical protein